MNIKKCDFCEKEIDEPVVASIGLLSNTRAELCDVCGKPILDFLRKNKIIDKNNKRIKKS